MIRNYLFFVLFILCNNGINGQEKISIAVKPAPVFIEQGENNQYINFDFLVANHSTDSLSLSRISLEVRDKNNVLVQKKFLDNNGTAPSIEMIPNRKFPGISSQLIFNPFADFNLTVPIHHLVYEFVFSATQEQEIKVSIIVNPKIYVQRLTYRFPLKGKVLVYDAHDLYAHHRRFNYEFPPIKALGLNSNFMRYAYDFVPLDKNNQEFKGEGKKDEDYIGFGNPVLAVGAGKVIYVSNDHKDDNRFDIPALATNPLELYGNCIAILHPDSAVSIYGHLKQNSIKLKTGEKVTGGQEIGKIGVSGSSFFPHLHFEMRTNIRHDAEGLPSYFSNIYLSEGARKTKLASGLAETGHIIEAK
ncbi:MAG: M23 family metallopeptidase [Chitinophagaceae bacterium]